MKNKKLLAAVAVVAVLALAFYFGGGAPGSRGWTVEDALAVSDVDAAAPSASVSTPETEKPETSAPEHAEEPEPAAPAEPEHTETSAPETPAEPEHAQVQNTDRDAWQTAPVPEGKPAPVEPQEAEVTEKPLTCTLSISCSTILDNMALCDPEKVELVPADGWLLEPLTVPFYEGENVFNVLQRTCKQQKIHMEYEDTPIYNSAYIEGIGNLYEFDVGEKSGWMYNVNGWFPNYGCSRYQLEDGDEVCWVYTCDLGADVGDNSLTG